MKPVFVTLHLGEKRKIHLQVLMSSINVGFPFHNLTVRPTAQSDWKSVNLLNWYQSELSRGTDQKDRSSGNENAWYYTPVPMGSLALSLETSIHVCEALRSCLTNLAVCGVTVSSLVMCLLREILRSSARNWFVFPGSEFCLWKWSKTATFIFRVLATFRMHQ